MQSISLDWRARLALIVAMSAWIILKEQISKHQWLGFFIALCGVIWMSWESDVNSHAPNQLLGNSLELMAMLCGLHTDWWLKNSLIVTAHYF